MNLLRSFELKIPPAGKKYLMLIFARMATYDPCSTHPDAGFWRAKIQREKYDHAAFLLSIRCSPCLYVCLYSINIYIYIYINIKTYRCTNELICYIYKYAFVYLENYMTSYAFCILLHSFHLSAFSINLTRAPTLHPAVRHQQFQRWGSACA